MKSDLKSRVCRKFYKMKKQLYFFCFVRETIFVDFCFICQNTSNSYCVGYSSSMYLIVYSINVNKTIF